MLAPLSPSFVLLQVYMRLIYYLASETLQVLIFLQPRRLKLRHTKISHHIKHYAGWR